MDLIQEGPILPRSGSQPEHRICFTLPDRIFSHGYVIKAYISVQKNTKTKITCLIITLLMDDYLHLKVYTSIFTELVCIL